MKYLKQIFLILAVSFLGELLHTLLPWPIPASIYGMVLLFVGLFSGLIRLEQVREGAAFLTSILPVLFVAPAVSLLDCWQEIRPFALQILLIIVLSTVVTFGVSGKLTAWMMRRKDKEGQNG